MRNPLCNLHNLRFVNNRLGGLALIVGIRVVALAELILVGLLRLANLNYSVRVSLHVIQINWFNHDVALF